MRKASNIILQLASLPIHIINKQQKKKKIFMLFFPLHFLSGLNSVALKNFKNYSLFSHMSTPHPYMPETTLFPIHHACSLTSPAWPKSSCTAVLQAPRHVDGHTWFSTSVTGKSVTGKSSLAVIPLQQPASLISCNIVCYRLITREFTTQDEAIKGSKICRVKCIYKYTIVLKIKVV